MGGLVRVQSGTDDSAQAEVRTPTCIGQFAPTRSALRPDRRLCAGLAVDGDGGAVGPNADWQRQPTTPVGFRGRWPACGVRFSRPSGAPMTKTPVHHRNVQQGGAMTGRARHHPEVTGGLAGPRAEKAVSLALQGGGAHGAFTWGVLDALLEDGRLAIEAITGASAGAMNAVVMVQGWLEGGIDGARGALETFWRRASVDGSLSRPQRWLLSRLLGFWSNRGWTDAIAGSFSPYQTNPLNINPLRNTINALIDFDRVRACTDVEIFLSATNVWTGK